MDEEVIICRLAALLEQRLGPVLAAKPKLRIVSAAPAKDTAPVPEIRQVVAWEGQRPMDRLLAGRRSR